MHRLNKLFKTNLKIKVKQFKKQCCQRNKLINLKCKKKFLTQ